jgi:hypothetical protein
MGIFYLECSMDISHFPKESHSISSFWVSLVLMQRIYSKGEVFEFPQYLFTCRRFIPRWKFLGIPNINAEFWGIHIINVQ